MTERTSYLKKMKIVYEETTSQRPPIVVHSDTPGVFPDGTPFIATRFRKGFFCYARDLMILAVRKGEVLEQAKINLANEVNQYLTQDIATRPHTLLDSTMDGSTMTNIPITETDVGYITDTIITFLSGTDFEIVD